MAHFCIIDSISCKYVLPSYLASKYHHPVFNPYPHLFPSRWGVLPVSVDKCWHVLTCVDKYHKTQFYTNRNLALVSLFLSHRKELVHAKWWLIPCTLSDLLCTTTFNIAMAFFFSLSSLKLLACYDCLMGCCGFVLRCFPTILYSFWSWAADSDCFHKNDVPNIFFIVQNIINRFLTPFLLAGGWRNAKFLQQVNDLFDCGSLEISIEDELNIGGIRFIDQ